MPLLGADIPVWVKGLSFISGVFDFCTLLVLVLLIVAEPEKIRAQCN
jgi:hypothetical protein